MFSLNEKTRRLDLLKTVYPTMFSSLHSALKDMRPLSIEVNAYSEHKQSLLNEPNLNGAEWVSGQKQKLFARNYEIKMAIASNDLILSSELLNAVSQFLTTASAMLLEEDTERDEADRRKLLTHYCTLAMFCARQDLLLPILEDVFIDQSKLVPREVLWMLLERKK